MRLIALVFSMLIIGSLAHAERVVFESTTRKVWSDYRVQAAGFDWDRKNNGLLIVYLEDRFAPIGPPNQPPNNRRGYEDAFQVPGLKFDRSIGKRGALVYSDGTTTTTCTVKKWLGQKETGKCLIDIVESFNEYTIRLVVK